MGQPKRQRGRFAAALMLCSLLCVVGGPALVRGQETSLTISVWSCSPDLDEALDQAVEQFAEDHGVRIDLARAPDAAIYWDKLTVSLTSGVLPDILWIQEQMVDPLVARDYLLPLDDLIAEHPEMIAGVPMGALDMFRYQDKLYGIPFGDELYYPWGAWALSTAVVEQGEVDVVIELLRTLSEQVLPLPLNHMRNLGLYSARETFLVSDENWHDVLQWVSVATWSDPKTKDLVRTCPVLIYHREGDSFDADAIIRFLQRYEPTHLTILGSTPQGLDNLLVASQPTGAGLQVAEISKYSPNSYLSFWMTFDRVVVSEDEYETGLMAAVFASLLDAPLLFDGHFDPTILDGVRAYVVGDVSQATRDEIKIRCIPGGAKTDYTLEDLSKAYGGWTGTDKAILVNPDDLTLGEKKSFRVEKWSVPAKPVISSLYTGHSLVAPFLAAAKHEVILSTTDTSYLAVDGFVEKGLASLQLQGSPIYLTIVASPRAIPMARENRSTPLALSGSQVVFEEFDLTKIDSGPIGLVVVSNTPTGTASLHRISGTSQGDLKPAIFGDRVVWQDNRNSNSDIYLYNLTTQTETQITTDTSQQEEPAICGDYIVWQDNRHGNWDIYLYDLGTGQETRVTTHASDQRNPAIDCTLSLIATTPSKPTIVWEDNRYPYQVDGKIVWQWDIFMSDLASETRITDEKQDQTGPSVSFGRIVWEDTRHAQSDVYLYDIATGTETRITSSPGQHRAPSVSQTHIVWEDSRHGNHDVYVYDLKTKKETRLTGSDNEQIRPVVQGSYVAWFSEGQTAVGTQSATSVPKSDGGHWLTYLYDLSTGKGTMLHENHLAHEYISTFRQEVDGRFYGSQVNYGQQDRAVGRIFGLTTSDVSAYVARDLFLADITEQNRDALLIVREDHNATLTPQCPGVTNAVKDGCTLEEYAETYWTPSVSGQFDPLGQEIFYGVSGGPQPVDTPQNLQLIRDLYDESYLILYADHGGPEGFDIVVKSAHLQQNNVSMLPATVLDLACATCTALNGYTPAWKPAHPLFLNFGKELTFCMENIRRGAMVFMGAVDLSYWHKMFDNLLERVFVDGQTIGQAYLAARNEDYSQNVFNFCQDRRGDPFYALIGDPTFKPRWW